VKQDWPQYHQLARTRGSIYGNVTGIRRGDSSEASDSQQSSPRRDRGVEERERYEHEQDLAAEQERQERLEQDHARLSVDDQQRYQQARTPSPRPSGASSSNYPLSPTLKALYPHDQSEEELRDSATPGGGGDSSLRRRKDHKRHSTSGHNNGGGGAQPFIPRDTAINRTDLIASAERIYSRYLMPGSDKEIYLPHTLRITSFPISSSVLPSVTHPTYDSESQAQARVPDMFHTQKEFVYRQMESDSFPRFLRAKAFGNLTGISGLVRLGVGLVSLWAGLATAFALIFLDKKPKATRLWVR